MTDDRQALEQIRSQTMSLIQEITAQPKPSYELDGQRVSWTEYLERLLAVVDWCDRQLASLSPCELRSLGTT